MDSHCRRRFAAFCLSLLCPALLLAHPHMSIDTYLEFETDSAGILGFRQKWIVTGEIGTTLAARCDADGDGAISPEEESRLRKHYFDAIRGYYYFTRITIDGDAYVLTEIEDFSAVLEGGRLAYRFYVPLRLRAGPVPADVEVAVVDETTYVVFALRYLDDPASTPSITYESEILFDFGNYSTTNPFGAPYVVIRMTGADGERDDGQAQPSNDNIRLIWELPPRPGSSIDNPFLFDQSLLKAPAALNPFMGG